MNYDTTPDGFEIRYTIFLIQFIKEAYQFYLEKI